MACHLKIHDPSGETRLVALSGPLSGMITLGRDRGSQIILRDPTTPPLAGIMTQRTPSMRAAPGAPAVSLPYWLTVPPDAPPAKLGDLHVREAQIPFGTKVTLGETTFELMYQNEIEQRKLPPLPALPNGVKAWTSGSESGRKLLWTARKAAETSLSLYLEGETGTGKEVLAHLLHAWSPRRSGPFVPLHCGALPLSLVESELFGHVKGAFTGAIQQRPGALLQAHGGTLFLDEIGDLPMDIQVKLLRFLENGEIKPVGADHVSRADVRLVCATHRSLSQLVEEGKFRRDLFYRLASITLQIPTLRSRPEDIELLAKQFATKLGKSLSSAALIRLKAHAWPGNVRELQHAVERACGLSSTFSTHLNEDAFDFLVTPENISLTPELELGGSFLNMHEVERHVLLKALRITQGNRARAAELMGVARSTLFEMLKRHGIRGPRQVVA